MCPPMASSSGSLSQKAAESGIFDLRGPVGQNFYYEHRKGTKEHDAYAKLVGKQAKTQYKQDAGVY